MQPNQGKIVAIIPARGASKGIPKKNIIDFCGKPLITWTIKQAKSSRFIDRVFVSTDDKKIAEISSGEGAEIIIRPKGLSKDTSSSEDALLHAISKIEKYMKLKLIVFLQATSPLRENSDIDQAIKRLISTKADSLFSAALLEDYCIWSEEYRKLKSVTFNYKKRRRRQKKKPYYLENGSIYVFKPMILKKHNNRLAGRITMSLMPLWKSFEIDAPDDLEICEYYMKKKILKNKI